MGLIILAGTRFIIDGAIAFFTLREDRCACTKKGSLDGRNEMLKEWVGQAWMWRGKKIHDFWAFFDDLHTATTDRFPPTDVESSAPSRSYQLEILEYFGIWKDSK